MKNTDSKMSALARNLGLYIAFFCIGLGLISVISSNWQQIPSAVKLSVTALLLMLTAGGIYLSRRQDKFFLAEALIIFDAALIMAAIGLLLQIYHLQYQPYQYLFVWCLLTLPLLLISKKSILAFAWIPILSFASGYFIALNPWMQKLFICLSATPVLWTAGVNILWVAALLLLQKFIGQSLPAFVKAFRFWTLFNLIASIVQIDLMSNFNLLYELTSYYHPSDLNITTAYIVSAILFLGLCGICFWLKAGGLYTVIIGLTYLYALAAPALTPLSDGLPGFIYSLSVLLAMGIYGYQKRRPRLINIAALLAALRIFIGYIQVFGSLLTTGIGLIATGLLILIFIYGLRFIKRQTKIIGDAKNEK